MEVGGARRPIKPVHLPHRHGPCKEACKFFGMEVLVAMFLHYLHDYASSISMFAVFPVGVQNKMITAEDLEVCKMLDDNTERTRNR